MEKEFRVIKASGESEPFSVEKLRRSLQRSRVSPQLIDEVIDHVVAELRDGMKTSAIYRHAFAYLRRRQPSAAGRYNIKKAILELGPTGYPFEKFIAEIMKAQGFRVEVGKTVAGFCVPHEIDIIAENKRRLIMVEGKFHNQAGYKTDVKVALYVKARFDDVIKRLPHDDKKLEAWLVTNTKLTLDAVKYADCAGIKTIGWNHPPEGSLQQLVERAGLHPLTSLTSLSKYHKKQLIAKGLVLCRDIAGNQDILPSIGINKAIATRIMQEAEELCREESLKHR